MTQIRASQAPVPALDPALPGGSHERLSGLGLVDVSAGRGHRAAGRGRALRPHVPPRRRALLDLRSGAGHWVPYAAGLLVLAVALLSPLDPIGDKYLLSAHMMQHVLLSDIAPALLVLGLRAPILPLGLSRNALMAVAPGRPSGRVLRA